MDKLLEEIKKKEIEKFSFQIKELLDEIDKINKSIGDYPTMKMKPSDKYFHPIRYRRAENQLVLDRYIYESELKEKESKINEHKRNIELLTQTIRNNPLKNVDTEHESSIVEYCKQNGIEIKYETVEEAIEKLPNYFEHDVSFMIKAVRENPLYVSYDKTNDLSVLKETIMSFLEAYKDDEKSKPWREEYWEILNVLNSEKITDEDKKLCAHFLDYIKSLSKVNLHEQQYGKVSMPCLYSFKWIKEIYQTQMAKVLEKYYESDKYTIGLHATFDYFEGENPIFKQGLRNSNQSQTRRKLSRTVAYNIPFIEVINYHGITKPAGSERENPCNYVMLLPKDVNASPVWGSNEPDSMDNYVLPEYVIGYYIGNQGKDTKIIPNEVKDKATYQYLFADNGTKPLNIEEQKISL